MHFGRIVHANLTSYQSMRHATVKQWPLEAGGDTDSDTDSSSQSAHHRRRERRAFICILTALLLLTTLSWVGIFMRWYRPTQALPSSATALVELQREPTTAAVRAVAADELNFEAAASSVLNERTESEGEHHPCRQLPHTRALLHDWLTQEAHAALALLHSSALQLATLMIAETHDTCRLATKSREIRHGKKRHGTMSTQRGLYFDVSAQRYWTLQSSVPASANAQAKSPRRQRAHAPRAVWLPDLLPGDCVVCTADRTCAGEEEAEVQLRKTMAHAPDGWSMTHLHECQEGQAKFSRKHPHRQQRFKNECKQLCRGAHRMHAEEQKHPDEDAAAALSLACAVCSSMDAQVDAAADLELSGGDWNAEDEEGADQVMSALFRRSTDGDDNEENGVSPLMEPTSEGSHVRAFFLDWNSQLAGVVQLLHTSIHRPEQLRHLFADSHAPTSHPAAAASEVVFAAALQRPFRRHSTKPQHLYDFDARMVQGTLDDVAAALPTKETEVRLGGGGGGGMGMQLLCVNEGGDEDQLPLLTLGGGGGGGYRSIHLPRRWGNSTFKGGAGGGAGLQSWGIIAQDGEGATVGDGITVGGGGGGGLHMQFSKAFTHEMEMDEGHVVSHKHGASPDELIALPPEESDSESGEAALSDFPQLLAAEMRRCTASPTSKLLLISSGGAGGGVKMQLPATHSDASSPSKHTVKLHHSVGFRLQYDFSTCAMKRRVSQCAEQRPFPGHAPPPPPPPHEHVRSTLLVKHRVRADQLAVRPVPRPNETWSGEMQQRLAACLEGSREFSSAILESHNADVDADAASPAGMTRDEKGTFRSLLCACFSDAFVSHADEPGQRTRGELEEQTQQSKWMMPAHCNKQKLPQP